MKAKVNYSHSALTKKILRVLIMKAHNKHTINYEDLANMFDLPNTGNALGASLTPVLNDIFLFCEMRGLPRLTSLVVRKSGIPEGIPGKGFWLQIDPDLSIDEKRILTKYIHRECFNYFDYSNVF